jgi:uncharacterized FlaG/YvyC family protein
MDIASVSAVKRLDLTPQSEPLTPELAEQRREIVHAVKALNKTEMFGQGQELTYAIDRSTKRVVTRLVDKNTGEVLSQFPAEYVLRMAEENQQKP